VERFNPGEMVTPILVVFSYTGKGGGIKLDEGQTAREGKEPEFITSTYTFLLQTCKNYQDQKSRR